MRNDFSFFQWGFQLLLMILVTFNDNDIRVRLYRLSYGESPIQIYRREDQLIAIEEGQGGGLEEGGG